VASVKVTVGGGEEMGSWGLLVEPGLATLSGGAGSFTLRAGSGSVEDVRVLLVVMVVSSEPELLWRFKSRSVRLVRLVRTATLLSVGRAMGELADRFSRACMMPRTPAMMRSMEEARGIVIFVGNHSRVSQMDSRLVSHTQT
jgi:hypothetical protein